jgi:bacterioferritin
MSNRIMELLGKAYVDEWLAFTQYWVGSKTVAGTGRDKAIGEFLEHANDERRHADAIFGRLVQLGAKPAGDPARWASLAGCPYSDPNPATAKAVGQNIASERCAIRAYRELLAEAEDDQETKSMVQNILDDEIGHERDLLEILDGIKTASADIPLSRRAASTGLVPISKRAQDPVRRTAESLFKIIQFVMFRVPQKDKIRYMQRVRGKILRMPMGQMSGKHMPTAASIGQSIALVKNVLTGLNPFFIKNVAEELARMIAMQGPGRKGHPLMRRPI